MLQEDLKQLLLSLRVSDTSRSSSAIQLETVFSEIVSVEDRSFTDLDGGVDPGTIGYACLKFHERKFYSVKMANLDRDRIGAANLTGAGLTGGMSLAALVQSLATAGTLPAWPGLGVASAIALIAIGRLKPLYDAISFDDATALALAWRHSKREHGAQLFYTGEVLADLATAETDFGNFGFNEAKFRNALGNLRAKRLLKKVSGDCFQLTETVRVSTERHVTLHKH